MSKVCVLTATRAEYGLLKPVILKLFANKEMDVRVAVTGMHLSPDFGLTYREIEEDGIVIDTMIDILVNSDRPEAISKTMALAMLGFGEYFARTKPDMLVVLGDRYETLAVCIAAMNGRIPIAHIHGGETTFGAVDEVIRHAITKLSYLHFASAKCYKNRIIQLGENPERVFNVGALGVENAMSLPLMSQEELEESIGFLLGKHFGVVTFHPTTLEEHTAELQTKELLEACNEFPNMKYIFTKANADADGRIINCLLQEYVETYPTKGILVESLGSRRYLSALSHCTMVIGNSSSGIIEAPVFKKPTINIGERQAGRIQAASILNCQPQKESILHTMKEGLSLVKQNKLMDIASMYGEGNTSKEIVNILQKVLTENSIQLKKKFYDVEIEKG